jgi:hypothetical protein
MGNLNSNWYTTPAGMTGMVHRVVRESEKVGDVYVIMYSAGCDGTETPSQTIRAHHSVIVDVFGESTLTDIVGFEFGLCKLQRTSPSTSETRVPDVRVIGGFVSVPKAPGLPAYNPDLKMLKWLLIGKIEIPEYDVGNALLALQNFSAITFDDLTQSSKTWSDSVNCQQYCRLFVENLRNGVPYPFSVIGLNSLPEWFRGYEPFAINIARTNSRD